MAVTENTYTGDGSTVLFSFTFPYLDQSHVKVSLDGADTTAFTFANATTIQMNSAPGVGISVRIYRNSNTDSVESTFFPGSAIRSTDLNDNFLQSLYLNQETRRIAQEASLGAIADGSISSAKLGGSAVTEPKIASSAITESKIATGAVTETKLGSAAVTNAKIATSAVGTTQIANDAVTNAKIAAAAVNTDKLASSAVTADKIASAAVTQAKIGSNVLTPLVSSINNGPLAGFRNLLINANPVINQRNYVSGSNVGGANTYTLDRWRVVTSGQNISWTDSNGVRTVTAPAGGVEQVIEGVSILSGTYTLSWTGTALATVNGNAVTNGGQVTLTGNTNCTVRFRSGTFSLPQLEIGSVATPFELRPYSIELQLCHRYYRGPVEAQAMGSGANGTRYTPAAGGNRYVGHITLSPPMRVAPIITLDTSTILYTNCSGLASGGASANGNLFYVVPLAAGAYAASAWFASFDAEIT